jgi:hypothetical protein
MTKKEKLELAGTLLVLRTASIERACAKTELDGVSIVNIKMFARATVASYMRDVFHMDEIKSHRIAEHVIAAHVVRDLTSVAHNIVARYMREYDDRGYECAVKQIDGIIEKINQENIEMRDEIDARG